MWNFRFDGVYHKPHLSQSELDLHGVYRFSWIYFPADFQFAHVRVCLNRQNRNINESNGINVVKICLFGFPCQIRRFLSSILKILVNLFFNMNLNEIVFEKISEWFNWPQLPLYIFGILKMILLAVDINFLRSLWKTNNQSHLHSEIMIRSANRTDNRGHRHMVWNDKNSSHDNVNDCKSTSETSSMKPSRKNIAQQSKMEWEKFVPHKYLCSCRHKNLYLARRPIQTGYNSDSKYMNYLKYDLNYL